jgi:hypothetical protein
MKHTKKAPLRKRSLAARLSARLSKPAPGIALALLHLLSTHPASANPELERFFSSPYTYCDAQLLSTHWSESVSDAKATIGRKLNWGNADILNDDLRLARSAAIKRGVQCDFFQSVYTYDDAALLAKHWGVSVSDAKSIISDKLTWGNDAIIKSSLVEALTLQSPTPTPSPAAAQDELSRFFDSAYTYCDARLLSTHWGDSLIDAKARIGRKLNWGDTDVIESMLSDARAEAHRTSTPCRFDETGLSFTDAQALADYWRTNTGDAKARVAQLFTEGQSGKVTTALAAATK